MENAISTGPDRDATLRWLVGQGTTPFQRVATVLANRHKLAIIWELARGTKRFKELERALSPITAKTLTRNLRDLETMSLIVRESFEAKSPKVEYRLSPIGQALRPHIVALCHWAYEFKDVLAPDAPDQEGRT